MGAVLLPVYILIFVGLIYFIGIRPQQRRRKELEGLVTRLKPGDEVVTVSGIYGTISEIEDGGTLLLEVAEDVDMRFATGSIARLVRDENVPARAAGDATAPGETAGT
jgi:preprotein translocase subunit YajC